MLPFSTSISTFLALRPSHACSACQSPELFNLVAWSGPNGSQIGEGDQQVAGLGAETKEGVARGGAHPSMRNDEGRAPGRTYRCPEPQDAATGYRYRARCIG